MTTTQARRRGHGVTADQAGPSALDREGNPSETLLAAKQDRLENWHLLQELAGVR